MLQKNVDIPAIVLYVLRNYFNGLTKLFLNFYVAKFLNTFVKLFVSYITPAPITDILKHKRRVIISRQRVAKASRSTDFVRIMNNKSSR